MYDKEVYHFLVLHFPIAVLTTGYMFDVLYNIFKKEEFKNYVLWMMGIGIIWGLISIITGYITAIEMEHIDSVYDIFEKKHSRNMIICVTYFTILFVLKNKDFNHKILLFFHTAGIGLLMYGAHLGAKWADRI
tara:strand:- start:38 stop:436 length:399 start_codon:yes stop_codon:yes gene_type:complete